MTRVLVIGGRDAGISAGLRVHELAPDVRPLLVVADEYPNVAGAVLAGERAQPDVLVVVGQGVQCAQQSLQEAGRGELADVGDGHVERVAVAAEQSVGLSGEPVERDVDMDTGGGQLADELVVEFGGVGADADVDPGVAEGVHDAEEGSAGRCAGSTVESWCSGTW
ncbi:hypothetical protein OG439_22405 [Amycolatopsis sp. NBC_01307]|nr:hypothetical protein OG439_22405 [Amycolatopsis sp. NBC_01307]